jgi:hypothetical protein
MTKKELVMLREKTYKPPSETVKRCEQCKHWWPTCGSTGYTRGSCMAVEIRGEMARFECHAFGVCDLWEEKVKQ